MKPFKYLPKALQTLLIANAAVFREWGTAACVNIFSILGRSSRRARLNSGVI